MASCQDGSALEFCHGHKREQSQDSGAYIDWNSEDSASPVGNPDTNVNEEFITVVAVENGGTEAKKDETSFVTILAIGESEEEAAKALQNDREEEVLVYRLPGERLGFGLKFEGGTNTAENVKRLFIQSSAPDSPASRAKCSWGSLVEGDEILKIDGHVVKNMTRLDCVRCLKESSVVIKLYVRHKSRKTNRHKRDATEVRVNNGTSSSPMVVSAEMKKNIPPPPPVPPRKIARKSPVPSSKDEPNTAVNPPDGFCDYQNGHNPVPKARNIQGAPDETSKNLSKFVIRVPQKASHDSPDFAKRIIKRNGPDLKLIPPEPKVYLDLLALEECRNCESESDDTGSTISTVVGLSSVPNTTNSSFSDLRSSASSFCDSTNPSTPTSEPTTPVLDLSKILSPYDHTDNNDFLFTKLINGKDHDGIGYDEKISSNCTDDVAPLQPPLSFQDAPLSYGNEEMRANLTGTLDFHDESLSRNQHDEIVPETETSPEGKFKDNKSTILSKKPSLIPRLAKSIGLLSPPKPSPRKESNVDGNKSRSNKKKPPPPLPPSDVVVQNSQTETTESKTLKSSIPYLKKKKNKNEDSKKNSKSDKKSKSVNPSEECNREKSVLLPNESDTQNEENVTVDAIKPLEAQKTPENERKLTWEVPDLKNSKEINNPELDGSNTIQNAYGVSESNGISLADTDKFPSELENGEFPAEVAIGANGGSSSDTHYPLFPWVGSKQLETIGEDEEDFCNDDLSERYSITDKGSPIKIVEQGESQVLGNNIEIWKIEGEQKEEVEEGNKSNNAPTTKEEKMEKISDGNTEKNMNNSEILKKKDDSEANGPKQKNSLCNNHVLVKLDNDSLEVVKNVDLNTSNGGVNESMVPVVPTALGLPPPPSFSRMPPDGHEFPQNYTEESLTEESVMTAKVQDDPRPESSEEESVVLPPLPSSEPPPTPQKCLLLFDGEPEITSERKYLRERTSLEPTISAKPSRNSFWRQDEKSGKSVRDKIAMFSSVPDSGPNPSNGSGKLGKYKSSDDVFYYDDADCGRNFQNGKMFSRSVLSLDKMSNGGSSYAKKSFGENSCPPRSLDYTNRTQSSMDLSSSSSSAYSSSCSPDSSLSSNSSYLGYSSTLPRKKNRSEDSKSDANKKDIGIHRATSFSVHGRSQSLLDVNPSPYKSRYLSESSQDDGQKPGSLNLLIEQRRKNLSKLRGLVIPEKLSDTISGQPIVDLPEIKSRELILNSTIPNVYKEKTKTNTKWNGQAIPSENSAPKIAPTNLWDIPSKTPNIPKYSPAFKRKSISVFGGKEPSVTCKKEIIANPIQRTVIEPLKAPLKPPRSMNAGRQLYPNEDRKYQDKITSIITDGDVPYLPDKHRINDFSRSVSADSYVPKRKSAPQSKYRLHSDLGRSEEDSDNDSAVSSSRSSISHGFSPPASPLLDNQYSVVEYSNHRSGMLLSPERSSLSRTPSSETTTSNASTPTSGSSQASISSNDGNSSDPNNKRILKPQSVEAINRKNVLASAKYSRGFDLKSGSPLIQRKFAGEASRDGVAGAKESDLPNLTEAFSIVENFYARKYSTESNGQSPDKKDSPAKPTNAKIAYITDVVDVTDTSEDAGKKKLKKSESLPSEPTIVLPPASRRTSVPYAYSWGNGNGWNPTDKKQSEEQEDNYVPHSLKNNQEVPTKAFSTDKPSEKSFEYSRFRLKTEKSSETDSSVNLKSFNESVPDKNKTSKVESRSAQLTLEGIPNGSRRSVSVNDIRKAFEKVEPGSGNSARLSNNKTVNVTASSNAYCGINGNHVRVSSLDSTTSEDNCSLFHGQYGSSTNLHREQFGSITSLASSTSLISPQELQLLIEEANQTLEESVCNTGGGSSPNNHDVLVIILHRDTVGGSVGITLAGGADYESKEITVHKVLAGSPADRDGRIQKGDRILSINGKSMKGVTHRESLSILKAPRLEVVLVVSRLKSDSANESVNPDDVTPVAVRHSFLSGSSRPPRILEGSTLSESDESSVAEIPRGPPVTLVLIKDGAGLGFSLEGGKDCPTGDKPLVIKKIFTGGAAEKCGQLKAGDELIKVNGTDVSVMSRIEAWKLMKQIPDGNVTITVKHQVE